MCSRSALVSCQSPKTKLSGDSEWAKTATSKRAGWSGLGIFASKLPGHLIGEVSPTPEVPGQTQKMYG